MKKTFTVSDACKLESLNGVTVLSGNDNLNHEIEHINVMEVPDIDYWVQENELLMTTGYMYRDNPEKFISLIPKLKDKNVAALGIKPKRFVNEIPLSVIECAKAYNFPLLLLPEHTTFSLVIRECMEKILLSEKEQKSSFFKRLLTGTYHTATEAINSALSVGLPYSQDSLFTLLIIAEKEDHVMYEKEALYSKLKTFFRSKNIDCHHVIHHNHLLLFLSYDNKYYLSSSKKNFKELEQPLHDFNGCICEYSHDISILDVPAEYERLKKMEKAVELCNVSSSWVSFHELGLYSIIPEMSDSLFYYHCKSKYIDPLKSYDLSNGGQLLETLTAFYSCNCNMKNTATQMYTHYNTICHRIEKIEELLNIDLHDFHTQCTLYLALMADNVR